MFFAYLTYFVRIIREHKKKNDIPISVQLLTKKNEIFKNRKENITAIWIRIIYYLLDRKKSLISAIGAQLAVVAANNVCVDLDSGTNAK